MSYALRSVYETASIDNNNTSKDTEYRQYRRSSDNHNEPSKTYSNDYHNSSISNGHHRLDDIEDESVGHEEQQLDIDYEEIAPDRPRLLMWGLTKSGKTSIVKLIFEKMTAGETLQLPETKTIQIHELTCGIHVRFQMRDVPGPKTASLLNFDSYSSECTTIVFILDAADDCSDAINLLVSSVQRMYSNGRNVRFEVLIHKIDGVHESDRLDRHSQIQQQVTVMLQECSIQDPLINFYMTSIYDHSIHEAFSKIVQNQMRQLRALENMLDLVTASTQLDKIFVCDIYNKICLASDTKPVESQISELCCDVVDVYTDISSIYGKSKSPVLDSMSCCTVELSIGLVLYLKNINPTTALICILKKEPRINEALMDVNLNILRQNIQKLFLENSNRVSRRPLNRTIQ